jgi:nitrate/TMAO reductase-like tetraheme cytochrome c subunit
MRFASISPAWALAVLLTVAPGALQAAPAAPSDPNETCLACHSDKDAKATDGRPIAVDGARFAKSVHGESKLACTACHSDVSEKKIPHGKVKPVDCGTCHEKPVAEYKDTVHGKARKGGSSAAAECIDCHGKHDILRNKDPASRTNHANLEATCANCHGKDSVKGSRMPGGAVATQFHDSIHGKALAGAARSSAPTCTNCHGAHSIRAKDDEKSRVNRAAIPDTCGACHTRQREQYANGRHGKLRQEGNLATPGCSDCHSAHRIQAPTTAAFQAQVVAECGTCHANYMESYRETFHGQVTNLGYVAVATCAACHGAHDIRPASDPGSTISPQNRRATCMKCHAGATASFAGWDPHANKHDAARNPLYFYTAFFMKWLLIGVFTFFGIHTVLWLYRSLVTAKGKVR